jgi:HTH-type transcriptional regulator, transcriptional repressor of NAD biosynthesis genes
MSVAQPAKKIALLGAESTGKSQLAQALAAHLREAGDQAVAVDEYLREWCEQKGRTPKPHEQAEIALTQRLRIEQASRALSAAAKPDQTSWIIADTTPLMTAIYSEFIFSDASLTPSAISYQTSFDFTLLTGLDMPWEADGIQRDGAHVRAPVDALLRERLQDGKISFEVIYGMSEQRLQAALRASNTTHLIANYPYLAGGEGLKRSNKSAPTLIWTCDKCSDPTCEHQLFTRLTKQRSASAFFTERSGTPADDPAAR